MKILKLLDERLEEIICVFALTLMTLVIFIQIILRSISSFVTIPMAWTEEIGRYLFIYAVYVGAAYATRKQAHQKVDLLPIMLGDKGKLIFKIIGDLGVLVFAGVMTYFSWEIVANVALGFGQKAPATKINMAYAYAGPALGMLLCAYRSLQNIIIHVRQFSKIRNMNMKINKGEN